MNVSPNDPGILRAMAEGRIVGAAPEPKAKPSKFRNVKTLYRGILFDSKKESQRFAELKLMLASGLISKLKLQVCFKLRIKGKVACKYIADFSYVENGLRVVEDVKSAHTKKLPMYKLKKKMMLIIHGIEIKET